MKWIAVFCFAVVASAQGPSVLEGQIDLTNSPYSNGMSVHLKGPWPARGDVRTGLESGGAFQFSDVKPGTYTLQVLDESGHEIVSQTVQVSSGGSSVSLSIPEQYRDVASSDRVSVASLLHKPKASAYKACLRAQKFSEAHDYQRAATELEKAVTEDPLFAAAHGNLAAEYARLLRLDDAAFELRRAIELDPGTGLYYSDLAWVMARLSRFPEAETFAQRGVDLNATNAKAQLLLGWLEAKRPEASGSAIPHLVFAGRELPEAHRILADLYHQTGRELLAQEEMRKYTAAMASSETPGDDKLTASSK
jgi:Tfp pilus assembly protein PilF